MNARLPLTLDNVPEEKSTSHYVWESRFGTIRIDVVDGVAYVNGERVEPVQQPDLVDPVAPNAGL